jgi:hypothetical protein
MMIYPFASVLVGSEGYNSDGPKYVGTFEKIYSYGFNPASGAEFSFYLNKKWPKLTIE